ncbi:CPBP family glutamic-type intramembrane protease [Methanolobus sediminis]|uniref:CPBP family glutamic-type intramembrane protease n=1 Tax=Methanolobus sediminis TaxID=3072978 RepID=A0AA51UMN2_9EURY|nr:CPBP family glutamic-type intramembrane protease [Methanolobus sediminis]WMW25111.1 CPBP family glutamic-type intramembrane protease [Methanolobus sediminis]
MKFRDIRDIVDWNVYWLLFMLAEFSLLAALPYAITMSGDALYDMAMAIPTILAAQFARSTVILLIGIFTGLYLGKKVGLKTPVLSSFFEDRQLPSNFKPAFKLSVIFGVIISLLILILDIFVFARDSEPLLVYLATPPLWQRFMYSFYVGVTEEVVLRLFLMTFLVWITWKIKKNSEGKATDAGAWLSIIIVSSIYSIIYLFFSRENIDPAIAMSIAVSNWIAGTAFGWIYWKKGLEYSIIANLTATMMLFVVFGSLVH